MVAFHLSRLPLPKCAYNRPTPAAIYHLRYYYYRTIWNGIIHLLYLNRVRKRGKDYRKVKAKNTPIVTACWRPPPRVLNLPRVFQSSRTVEMPSFSVSVPVISFRHRMRRREAPFLLVFPGCEQRTEKKLCLTQISKANGNSLSCESIKILCTEGTGNEKMPPAVVVPDNLCSLTILSILVIL
jgi:hypothetical protein